MSTIMVQFKIYIGVTNSQERVGRALSQDSEDMGLNPCSTINISVTLVQHARWFPCLYDRDNNPWQWQENQQIMMYNVVQMFIHVIIFILRLSNVFLCLVQREKFCFFNSFGKMRLGLFKFGLLFYFIFQKLISEITKENIQLKEEIQKLEAELQETARTSQVPL